MAAKRTLRTAMTPAGDAPRCKPTRRRCEFTLGPRDGTSSIRSSAHRCRRDGVSVAKEIELEDPRTWAPSSCVTRARRPTWPAMAHDRDSPGSGHLPVRSWGVTAGGIPWTSWGYRQGCGDLYRRDPQALPAGGRQNDLPSGPSHPTTTNPSARSSRGDGEVGKDSVITVEEAKGLDILEIVEASGDRGYLSPLHPGSERMESSSRMRTF